MPSSENHDHKWVSGVWRTSVQSHLMTRIKSWRLQVTTSLQLSTIGTRRKHFSRCQFILLLSKTRRMAYVWVRVDVAGQAYSIPACFQTSEVSHV